MHATKRRRISPPTAAAPTQEQDADDSDYAVASGSGSDDDAVPPSGDDASPDTEDEITRAKPTKSKQTAKRKHRATDPANFGAALQSLLSTDAPSTLPLSLKPSINRKRNDAKLETKARKVLQVERKEKEDNRHVTDVIGGWGAESERALRKVAQRGVVRLFNTIQQSQSAAAQAVEETKASRGSGKPSLPAPVMDSISKGKKGKKKDNIIGRAKETNLDQEGFLDMIRSGGVVSKA